MTCTYMSAPGLGKPTPLHAMTDSAEAAREAVRAHGRSRRAAPEVGIVARNAPPWRRIGIDEAPRSAAAFWRAAEALGYEVAGRAAGARSVQVGVARGGRLWMRATWWGSEHGPFTSRGVIVAGEPGVVPITAARAMLAVESGA